MRKFVLAVALLGMGFAAQASSIERSILSAATKYSVDPYLVQAVIEQETSTTPYAVGINGHPFMFENKQRALALLHSLKDTPYLLVMKRKGQKNKRYLFGTAYQAKQYAAGYPSWKSEVIHVRPWKVDVGIMQINVKYHGHNFRNFSEMLDVNNNIHYGTRFLSTLISKHGTARGIGRYNASDEVKLAKYSKSVLGHYKRITNQH